MISDDVVRFYLLHPFVKCAVLISNLSGARSVILMVEVVVISVQLCSSAL